MTKLEYRDAMLHELKQHRFMTHGFTLDYSALSDEEAACTRRVPQWLLDMLISFIPCIVPWQRPDFKNSITYLQGLRDRQIQAIEAVIEDSAKRVENCKAWIEWAEAGRQGTFNLKILKP